jgi:hypothetical protein
MKTNLQMNVTIVWDIVTCMWTDVSKERVTSIFRAENKLKKKNVASRWHAPPKRRFIYGLHGDISQKTTTFILPGYLLHAGLSLAWISTLKVEMKRSSETLVHIQTTWRYIPEDGNIHNYRCDNLISKLRNNSLLHNICEHQQIIEWAIIINSGLLWVNHLRKMPFSSSVSSRGNHL